MLIRCVVCPFLKGTAITITGLPCVLPLPPPAASAGGSCSAPLTAQVSETCAQSNGVDWFIICTCINNARAHACRISTIKLWEMSDIIAN